MVSETGDKLLFSKELTSHSRTRIIGDRFEFLWWCYENRGIKHLTRKRDITMCIYMFIYLGMTFVIAMQRLMCYRTATASVSNRFGNGLTFSSITPTQLIDNQQPRTVG
jgi:hypothetical protein